MTLPLRFLAQVEEDLVAGHTWYEGKSPGLGEEFLRAFYASAGEISHNPLLWPCVYDQFRRHLLRRFPYAVYFTIEDGHVIVFGIFHCARDPRAIQNGITDRNIRKSP